jgi:sulfur carrier protein
MHIHLNGDCLHVNPGCTLEQLVLQLQLAGKRIAIEINGQIVPRSQFPHLTLKPDDRVEIVQAIGGG